MPVTSTTRIPGVHTRINESDGEDAKSDGNVTLVMADGATVSIGSGTGMGGPECTAKAGRQSSIPERRIMDHRTRNDE